MIKRGFAAFKGERVLLLQGPLGPFFRRLSKDLALAGASVFKVNFNGGDWFFYPTDSFNYRGRMEDWPAYLEALLDRLQVDVVILFGDCRPIHAPVHKIAHSRGLKIGVFEEGYIRPDYITLERIGVNAHSVIPRNPKFYLNNPISTSEPMKQVGNTFWFAVRWAMLYYFSAGLLKPFFAHYRHHRPLNWLEALPWLRSAWRKGYYAIKERGILARLTSELNGQFFLVPLQVHNDAQVHTHSDFDSIRYFIHKVMMSFAQHAPKNTTLIIKHHPMDRAYHDYTHAIKKWAQEFELQGRCHYIHGQHLPTLLQSACGVVVINSTVGLSALTHGTPVKVCGKSIYNMQGLTFQEPLDDFWRDAQQNKPDPALLEKFKEYLISHTQLNGSYYKRLPIKASSTGLAWTLQNEAAPSETNTDTELGESAEWSKEISV